jgi:ATP diphosphatase
MNPSRDIGRLLELMAALRTPGSGCPWDLEQNFETIAPYTIEEAYEVAEAIARGDLEDLRDELGDLLLQVVFHARMAEEAGAFDFGDVVHSVTAKLMRRHPHVFGDAGALSVAAVNELWDRIKAEEKEARAAKRKRFGADYAETFAGVPTGLPALARALKLQQEGRNGRVRLERSTRRARQDPRGGRRDRGRARACRARPHCGRDRGSIVCRG